MTARNLLLSLGALAIVAACSDTRLPVEPNDHGRALFTYGDGNGPAVTPTVVAMVAGPGYNNKDPRYACGLDDSGAPLGFKVDNPAQGSGAVGGFDYELDGLLFHWQTSTSFAGTVWVKGGTVNNVYDYSGSPRHLDNNLTAPVNPNTGRPYGVSHVIFCYGGGDDPPQSLLTVQKFYDANADGVYQLGEALLEGWKFSLALGGAPATAEYTTYMALVNEGTAYEAFEYMPQQGNWMQTYPVPNLHEGFISAGGTTLEFGNLCIGAGGGYTLGFWSNKNGQRRLEDTPGALAALVALNLRNANGTHFDPATYAAFRTWLLNANATNMAYMLSAQMAAIKLNVLSGSVSGVVLIYAPGTTSANALGFATVAAVLAEADAELGLHGLVLSGSPFRTYQEALKIALDKANNNYNFVQPEPCAYTFPE